MAINFLDSILVKLDGTSSSKKYLQLNGGGGSGSVSGQAGVGFRPIGVGSNVHASIEALENGNASYQTNLTFNTNGSNSDSAPSERMRISSAGNVGIGTTSPVTKLDVGSTVFGLPNTSGTTANGMVRIGYNDRTWSGNEIFLGIINASAQNYAGYIQCKGPTDQSVTRPFLINPQGGNVGIGTTSPVEKLEVAGKIKSTVGFVGVASSGYSYMELGGPSGGYIDLKSPSTDDYDLRIISGGSGGSFWTGGYGHVMTLNTSGNVGIGTTSPGEKLEVSGTAKATSVRATGGGDGGFVLRQWTYASNYASLATNGMSNLEYCMISDGTNTFIGSGTNGTTRLRGPANDSAPQLEMTSTLCKIDGGDLKVEDGSLAVGNITNSTTDGRIDASNDIVAYSTSDIRLKDNIKSIDKALDKVNSIQGIEFDWIEKEEVHGNSGHDIGVIAQEIEKILPDVVTTRDNGYKAVKYEKIVPLLIEAIKDLSKQVDGLKRLI